MSQNYTIRLKLGADGFWVVTCDEVPEAMTQGTDVPHALEMMADAMDMMLEDREQDRR